MNDSAKLDIIKAKGLRGAIVEHLYTLYGETVAIKMIRDMLRYKGYNTDKDIKKAIQYLSGSKTDLCGAKKTFVEITIDEDDYWASLIQLTPTGVNLAEGDITDMGVLFNE